MNKNYTVGYFKSPNGNVGDDLNIWLWPKLLNKFEFSTGSNKVLIGIGSILDNRFDHYEKKLVVGAGARDNISLPKLDDSWDIAFVRGHNTARALSSQRDVRCITDPAILIANFFKKKMQTNKIGLIPYFRSNHEKWRKIAAELGYEFISPRDTVDNFIAKLRQCEYVLTEAMHGAIFADALRIPWYPYCSFTKHHEKSTHTFKWNDWASSLDIDFKEIDLPVMWENDSLLKTKFKQHKILKILGKVTKDHCYLSKKSIFLNKLEEMEKVIAALNE